MASRVAVDDFRHGSFDDRRGCRRLVGSALGLAPPDWLAAPAPIARTMRVHGLEQNDVCDVEPLRMTGCASMHARLQFGHLPTGAAHWWLLLPPTVLAE